MTFVTYTPPLTDLQMLIYEAGQIAKHYFEKDTFQVHVKEDQSPVTTADLAVNRAIMSGLNMLTPDIPILSEESSFEKLNETHTYYWCIDPIDGTKEFIAKIPEFTINIALIKDGHPTIGLIYAPMFHKLYWAIKGQGAFMQTDLEAATLSPLPVHKHLNLFNKSRFFLSRHHKGVLQQQLALTLSEVSFHVVGSTYKFCLMAENQGDAHIRAGQSGFWDTAAAQCILEETGGCMLNVITTQPLSYLTPLTPISPPFIALRAHSPDLKTILKKLLNLSHPRHRVSV